MKTNFSLLPIGFLGLALISIPSVRAADGTPLWTNRFGGAGYDFARAVAVDGSGNVYVTGTLSGGSGNDYATIKYSSTGVPLWTNRFNGTGNGSDEAFSLAVDGGGNVYVTGDSFVMGSAIDYVTIKYSSAGVPLWTNRFNGSASSVDHPSSVAVDGSGNVYVTGYSVVGIGSDSDYLTIKYSSGGLGLWQKQFNGPANGFDQARCLAVDGSGNVYVTGTGSSDTGGDDDYVTIKYSTTGAPVWTNSYGGATNLHDQPRSLAVDGNGNAYVTGRMYGGTNDYDYATIKYSSSGVPLWTNLFNSTGNGRDEAVSLAVDASGNVYVAGTSTVAGSGSGGDYLTIKYSSAGVALWANWFNRGNDLVSALALDSSGNVYVTGSSSAGDKTDWATVKYSAVGVPLWTNLFNGVGNDNDAPSSLVADGSGNVYVTGYSWGSGGAPGGNPDWVTIKYSSPSVPIPLGISVSGNQVVLSWTNAAFSLQSAPQATGVFTNLPGAISPYTNSASGSRSFFRLISN